MKQLKMKQKSKKGGGFIPMLLGTLVASFFGSALTAGAVIRAGENF